MFNYLKFISIYILFGFGGRIQQILTYIYKYNPPFNGILLNFLKNQKQSTPVYKVYFFKKSGFTFYKSF